MKHLIPLLLLLAALQIRAQDNTPPAAPSGEPNHGLVSSISTAGYKFIAGAPVTIHYAVRNNSDKPLEIWHSAFWPNHRIRVCDQTGAPVALTDAGRQRHDAFSPGGSRNKNFPVTIQPGREDASEGGYDVTQFYDMSKPGIYSIQYLYEEYQGGWEGQLWSNVIVIEITAK